MSVLLLLMFLTSARAGDQNNWRYLQLCPSQNVSLPCNPQNLDGFMSSSSFNSIQEMKNILSKAFTPGGCYSLSDKYCPHILSSCSHQDNMGYNWTLQAVKEMCEEVSCPADQYLCHPRGCLPLSSHCNGHCPHLQDGLLCGDSCLTGAEARSKYQCGDSCQRKSQPCSISSEDICPQHFQLCGSDTCIDSFLQEKSVAATGYGEYYDCNGECSHVSLPCLAASNNTHLCPGGYWLCEDANQCILKGYSFQQLQGEGFISNFCDGINHCKDGSDEKLGQCLQVYSEAARVSLIVLVVIIPLALGCVYCLRSYLLTFIIALCNTHTEIALDKSYHRNEGFSDYFPTPRSSCFASPNNSPPAPPPSTPCSQPQPASPSPSLSASAPTSTPHSINLIPPTPTPPPPCSSSPTLPPPPSTPCPPLPPPPPPAEFQCPPLACSYPRFVFTPHPPESYQPVETRKTLFSSFNK